MIQDEKNDYRMTALSHPKRLLELYRDRFFRARMTLEWRDGARKKSEQILIASIPVHPVILESLWNDSRMTEWQGLGFKPMEFLHPCPSRHPQSSEEWLRQERMTKNDEKFRSKAVALDFFPLLHPVILVSFHHKNGHPCTIPSFSCHPVIQRSQNMEAWR